MEMVERTGEALLDRRHLLSRLELEREKVCEVSYSDGCEAWKFEVTREELEVLERGWGGGR